MLTDFTALTLLHDREFYMNAQRWSKSPVGLIDSFFFKNKTRQNTEN